MTDKEMRYYTYAEATSLIESFNSYLRKWAPKQLFFAKSYPMRVQMAALDWNENYDKFRIGLERRGPPKKGKRPRGRSRSIALEPHSFTWRDQIIEYVVQKSKL
jgi:transposase